MSLLNDFIGFIEKITKDLGLSDSVSTIMLIAVVAIFLLIKLFNFWFQRKLDKEEQQFKFVEKIIEDDGYLNKIKNQPQILKQIIFRRIYWLQSFSVAEIDYLIEKPKLIYSIYNLIDFKKASILEFSQKQNEYILVDNKLTNLWIKKYQVTTFLLTTCFVMLALFLAIVIGATKSSAIFIISLVIIITLQIWLMNKSTAVKTYINVTTKVNR